MYIRMQRKTGNCASKKRMASTDQKQAPLGDKDADDRLETATVTGKEKEKVPLEFDEEGNPITEEEAKPAVIIPLKYRITAIILIILFGTGNTYAGFVLGPLKTRLVRELQITSKSRFVAGPG